MEILSSVWECSEPGGRHASSGKLRLTTAQQKRPGFHLFGEGSYWLQALSVGSLKGKKAQAKCFQGVSG